MQSYWYDSLLMMTVAMLAASLLVAWLLWSARQRIRWRDRPSPDGLPAGKLSVIVPARNEQQDLEQALRSILAQRNVELEVFVVNDHSTDATGAIADKLAAADARVQVIHDPPLPPGWLGKPNAMQHALARATGALVVLTDADVVHQPDCFAAAIAELHDCKLDLLSLFPCMECVSLWENVIAPLLVGGLAHLATPGINDPDSPDALAAGAFILLRAEALRAIGQFESIKSEVLDDVSLARVFKERGFRVALRAAPDLVQVRLFKDNAHAFWGPTKNGLGILRGRMWLAPAAALIPAIVYWTPLMAVAAGVLSGRTMLAVAGAATYVVQYAMLFLGWGLFRFRPIKMLLFPLVGVSAFCCIARALFHYVLRGAVLWRGRAVRIRGVQ